jgi:hypothetical protein
MKSCNQWSDEMNGETSPYMVKQIQQDAMLHAAEIAKESLIQAGRKDESRIPFRAIIDSIESL